MNHLITVTMTYAKAVMSASLVPLPHVSKQQFLQSSSMGDTVLNPKIKNPLVLKKRTPPRSTKNSSFTSGKSFSNQAPPSESVDKKITTMVIDSGSNDCGDAFSFLHGNGVSSINPSKTNESQIPTTSISGSTCEDSNHTSTFCVTSDSSVSVASTHTTIPDGDLHTTSDCSSSSMDGRGCTTTANIYNAELDNSDKPLFGNFKIDQFSTSCSQAARTSTTDDDDLARIMARLTLHCRFQAVGTFPQPPAGFGFPDIFGWFTPCGVVPVPFPPGFSPPTHHPVIPHQYNDFADRYNDVADDEADSYYTGFTQLEQPSMLRPPPGLGFPDHLQYVQNQYNDVVMSDVGMNDIRNYYTTPPPFKKPAALRPPPGLLSAVEREQIATSKGLTDDQKIPDEWFLEIDDPEAEEDEEIDQFPSMKGPQTVEYWESLDEWNPDADHEEAADRGARTKRYFQSRCINPRCDGGACLWSYSGGLNKEVTVENYDCRMRDIPAPVYEPPKLSYIGGIPMSTISPRYAELYFSGITFEPRPKLPGISLFTKVTDMPIKSNSSSISILLFPQTPDPTTSSASSLSVRSESDFGFNMGDFINPMSREEIPITSSVKPDTGNVVLPLPQTLHTSISSSSVNSMSSSASGFGFCLSDYPNPLTGEESTTAGIIEPNTQNDFVNGHLNEVGCPAEPSRHSNTSFTRNDVAVASMGSINNWLKQIDTAISEAETQGNQGIQEEPNPQKMPVGPVYPKPSDNNTFEASPESPGCKLHAEISSSGITKARSDSTSLSHEIGTTTEYTSNTSQGSGAENRIDLNACSSVLRDDGMTVSCVIEGILVPASHEFTATEPTVGTTGAIVATTAGGEDTDIEMQPADTPITFTAQGEKGKKKSASRGHAFLKFVKRMFGKKNKGGKA